MNDGTIFYLPHLRTRRLWLRPLTVRDLKSAFAYMGDAENTKYMMRYPMDDEKQTRAFLQSIQKEWQKKEPSFYEFAVWLDERHIGSVSLYPEEDYAELGFLLHRDYHGMGFGFEAAKAAVDFAGARLHLSGVIAHCDTQNIASAKVLEKLGMEHIAEYGGRQNKGSAFESREAFYILKFV